jgi:drug/metabolite transporter (DMT)-like permease
VTGTQGEDAVVTPATEPGRATGLRLTVWTSFAVLAIFLATIGTLYAATVDDEPAGVVLHYGAAILAAIVAAFVWWSTRQAEAEGRLEDHPPDNETPTPVYIAAGMALTGVGFIVGPFVLAPGVAILCVAVVLSIRERP